MLAWWKMESMKKDKEYWFFVVWGMIILGMYFFNLYKKGEDVLYNTVYRWI